MENKSHALIAGAFVVVVAALLALLGVWLTRDNTQRDLYEMSTPETITGLQPQAMVRFRGVPVGKVERIGFDDKVKGNVLIRMSIDRAAPVTQSTFATVASQGVTGLGFIQLDDNGESAQRADAQRRRPAAHPAQARNARQAAQAERRHLHPGRAGHDAHQPAAVQAERSGHQHRRHAAGRSRQQHQPPGQGAGADGGDAAGAVDATRSAALQSVKSRDR